MANLVFRVYHDTRNRDMSKGKLYNDEFELISRTDLEAMGGTVAINPVTPDQFELLRTAHDAQVPVTVEFEGLTDAELGAIGAD